MLKLATLAVAAALAGGSHQPAFEGHSERLDGKLRERIEGSSWHPGCPVGLDKLRLLDLTYRGFDGRPHRGRLVVNRRFDHEIVAVFKHLYRLGYPIRPALLRRRELTGCGSAFATTLSCARSPRPTPWRSTP